LKSGVKVEGLGKIFVVIFQKKWPLIIEIENNYIDLKEIRLIGKKEPQTIYTR